MRMQFKLECCNRIVPREICSEKVCRYCGKKNPICSEVDKEDMVFMHLSGFSGDKNYLIVQNISKSYKEILDHQIKFINSIGVSDGRYFSGDEIEIVCFGPGLDKEGHSANESIEIDSMVDSALILEKSISKILGYKKD